MHAHLCSINRQARKENRQARKERIKNAPQMLFLQRSLPIDRMVAFHDAAYIETQPHPSLWHKIQS